MFGRADSSEAMEGAGGEAGAIEDRSELELPVGEAMPMLASMLSSQGAGVQGGVSGMLGMG